MNKIRSINYLGVTRLPLLLLLVQALRCSAKIPLRTAFVPYNQSLRGKRRIGTPCIRLSFSPDQRNGNLLKPFQSVTSSFIPSAISNSETEGARSCDEKIDDETKVKDEKRRMLLHIASIAPFTNAFVGVDAAFSETNIDEPNFDCLLDLPQMEEGYVRVYLCRHGQTEFNRLRLVQGANIDPPLNDTGLKMGERIAMSLSRLPPSLRPVVAFHSTLERARNTAILASNVGKESTLPLEPLPSLKEVNFGDLEAKKVSEAKQTMIEFVAAWSIGLLDKSAPNGGETGKQVLDRAVEALNTFSRYGAENRLPILAVSHGFYIRALLALCLDMNLAKAAALETKNGCINVLDINVNGLTSTIDSKSNVLGGQLSLAKDVNLTFPKVKVIEINETRHLSGLL